MADLSDPQINEGESLAQISIARVYGAYPLIQSREDKSDTNWLLLDYETERSDKLKVTQTGSGGLAELREVLDESKASYAYVRVSYSNDKESVREKFVLVVWIGPQCKVMRKAKISVHSADVKGVLRVYSIEVAAREKDDLSEDPIVKRLRKAGGASYDGV
ncbi:hypothetical protein GYMLUDRAFT_237640 [Collybiopsis luxurians FD-317 M1]|nr:hypothetical protein GYMLUDRAFT_237640 [Collybiopsis luxurians FD-317 M1]